MEAVLNSMVEERVGPGDVAKTLSSTVSAYFASSYVAPFRSPAIALSYALSSMECGEGSSIALSPLSPFWVYLVLKKHNFNPIFVDVSSDSFFMDLELLKSEVKELKAIILGEPLGLMPPIEDVLQLGVPVIEDISQSLGAVLSEKRAGSFGDFAILGLEERDAITGGGGAILIANNKAMQKKLKELYTSSSSVDVLPDINASLALIQFRQHEKNNDAKKEFLKLYKQSLLQTKHKSVPQKEGDAIYSFPIMFSSSTLEIEKFVAKKGVEIKRAFENSIIAHLDSLQQKYINATSIFLRTYLFPLYPRLGKKKALEIAKIIAALP